MREIVLDTETTGLDPRNGDRVVEIGAVELVNQFRTDSPFHKYINPERSMPSEAYRVHGLSEEFLADKPKFAEIAEEFVKYIEGADLIAHNASFDMGFLNVELERLGYEPIDDNRVIDTLQIARRKHPGGQNSLDALCSRYGIDNSRRTKHGALLDAELLADVYIELIGGRQAALGLTVNDGNVADGGTASDGEKYLRERPEPLRNRLNGADAEAHRAFVETLGENAAWRRYEDAK